MSELSVVDLPANKETFFEVIKNECIGNNCSNEINNYEEMDKTISENDVVNNSKNIVDKLEDNMAENIEMEMDELKEFVKSTVSEMITEQDTVEKVEGYDSAIKAVQDLEARIAELEAKVTLQAAQLKAQPQEAMKAEKDPEPVKETDEEKRKREAKEAEDARVGKLETEIAELKASPLYRAEQGEPVEKDEKEPVSLIGSIIKAHYGGT
jgi:outer membrane murein-binding lipoprotein Lpp